MPKKILIVDDDPDILEVTSMILEARGYEVSTSPDGNIIEAVMPDLLLLDIWMAGKYGSDICLDLKSREETRGIKVILISANRDISEIAAGCGADGFISKPFRMKDIVDQVEKSLGMTEL